MLLSSLRARLVLALALLVAALGFAQPAPKSGSDYMVGPEDVLTITVLNLPQFSANYFVPQGGELQIVGVGQVHVAGLTLEQITKIVTDHLKLRLKEPEVTVTLSVPRVRRIYVLGDVKTPGVLDVKPGWRIPEVLAMAGGLIPLLQPQDAEVLVERPSTGEKLDEPLDHALSFEHHTTWDFQTGDVMRIQSITTVPIYISGDVKAPGMVMMRADATNPLAAISMAGGYNADAALTNVKLIHLNGEEETLDLSKPLLKGEVSQIPKLQRGDMLLVPQSTDRFSVLGFVQHPGNYPLAAGVPMTLMDALALAGGSETVLGGQGATPGRLRKVGLVRLENGQSTRTIIDFTKYVVKGDPTCNPLIKPGDLIYVPQTDKVPLSSILQGISAVGVLLQGFNGSRISIIP